MKMMSPSLLKSVFGFAIVAAITVSCAGKKGGNDPKGPNADNADGQQQQQQQEQEQQQTANSVEIKKRIQIIRTAQSGLRFESYAMFGAATNHADLDLIGATVDGQELTNKLPGFTSAKIVTGKIVDGALDDKFSGESGLTAEEKAKVMESYKGATFIYLEGFKFDFHEKDKSHTVKLKLGQNGQVASEVEFVLQDKE